MAPSPTIWNAPVMLGDDEALVKVLSGRAGRSVVKPGEPAALYVKVKGKSCDEVHNDHVLLRGAALDAAFSAEYGDDWDVDDDSFSLEEALRNLLGALEVPWPIAHFVGDAPASLFRDALEKHRLRERGLRTLQAFAFTSAIGAVPFELFAQWLVYTPVLLQEVPKLLGSAAFEYMQRDRSTLWACEVAPSGEGGCLSDDYDGVSWCTTAVAVANRGARAPLPGAPQIMLGDEEALVQVPRVAGRASRSVVKPGEPAAVYVKIKGKAWDEVHNDHVLLRVMNTAGALQHAASFGEFMQQVLIEGAALDAAFSAEYCDDGGDDDKFEELLSGLLRELEALQAFASTSAIGAVPFELFSQWLVCALVLLADVPKLVHSAAAQYKYRGLEHLWECGVAPNGESGSLCDKNEGVSWSTTAAAVPDDDESNADY
ncbi:hypothetical protein M885DRAFT_623698 [Pelagophyceae sp. CCMP2097]|nr:hypothetical protein M885DRAFT_623698 [Pelagophyceae sp. CCMP2097]